MDLRNASLPSISIIADDLTSAADGGGPFVKNGLSVSVCGTSQNRTVSPCFDVVAIDCASRSMDAINAAYSVENATRELAEATILFKTIDSTLRGHIREELRAALCQRL